MKRKYYKQLLEKLEKMHEISIKTHKDLNVRSGNKIVARLSQHEIEDLEVLWKAKSMFFFNDELPFILRHPLNIDNYRYREFNSLFSIIKSGNHRYGKSFAMIMKAVDYSGFEIIEPPDELKEAFEKINKSATWLCLKEKEATDGKKN